MLTEWKEFRTPDFNWLSSQLTAKVVFDGRALYSPSDIIDAGMTYFGIGRKIV